MKSQIRCATAALFAAATIAAGATPPAPAASVDPEGLREIKVEGVQHVYARPGADLGRYSKVILDPIEVSFRKDWKPAPQGYPITAAEKQKIRAGLAQVLREEFARELGRSGRYRVVDAPDEDVLRIRAEIRDLSINAPDLDRPGIVRNYTLSVGELTLVAELRDAPTGDLLARVVDHRKDPESAWLKLTTRVENIAAAREVADRWAGILRRELDAAHVKPQESN